MKSVIKTAALLGAAWGTLATVPAMAQTAADQGAGGGEGVWRVDWKEGTECALRGFYLFFSLF